MDGRVEVLALDGNKTWRTDQQVVDLTAPVAVAAQQDPVITEYPAELPDDLLFAGHSGLEPFFEVTARLSGAAPGRRQSGRRRSESPQLEDRDRGAYPGEPLLACAGPIARVRRAPQQ